MADTTTTRFPPTKPHFFKPLTTPNFRDEILIPMSFFIKYLDGQRCEKAVLRSGRGKVWPVNINDGRRIVDGWKEFVQDNDLHEGDFLVFKHEGNMVFDVMIFEPSACEREYPPFDFVDKVDDDDDDLVEENQRFKSKTVKQEFNDGSEDVIVIKKKKNTMSRRRVEANATSSTRGNPSFEATLRPTYKKSKILFIPKYFSRLYGLNNGCREIILKDQKQRSWPVGLGKKMSENRVYFKLGWHDFCVANRLKEGDSFVFELVKRGNKPIMNFHRLLGANSMDGRVTTSEDKPSVSTPKSSFCGVISPSNLTKYRLTIPKEFARSNDLTNKCCKMILRNKKGGGSWQVILAYQKSGGQVYIGRGWNEFAVENGLEAGDEFKIELVKGGKMLIMDYYGGN